MRLLKAKNKTLNFNFLKSQAGPTEADMDIQSHLCQPLADRITIKRLSLLFKINSFLRWASSRKN